MNSEVRDALAVRQKEAILQYAQGIGNAKEACRDLNVPRSSFYRWKKAYAEEGKVERSHRSDQEEFYQLLTYTDDVNLNKKLATWEQFYNLNRPQWAHNGKTPYETLRTMLE